MSREAHPERKNPTGGKMLYLDPPKPMYVAANCPPDLMEWLLREVEKKKAKEARG